MNKLSILLISFFLTAPSLSYAQKNATTGSVISANSFNSSTLSVGSVQQSILSVIKFKELNGDCWRLMDGSSIAGTDLATLAGITNLPDMTTDGTFPRQAKSGRVLGSFEGDAIRNITGSFGSSVGLAGIYAQDINIRNGAFSGSVSNGAGNKRGTSQAVDGWDLNFDASYSMPTADENRPKNVAFNFLIKVNKECNFN